MSNIPIDEEHFPDKNFREFVNRNYGNNSLLFRHGEDSPWILTGYTREHTYMMNCSGLDIKDLTGIEYFGELWNLNCRNNDLTTLDLRKNRLLIQLDCSGNTKLRELNYVRSERVLDPDLEIKRDNTPAFKIYRNNKRVDEVRENLAESKEAPDIDTISAKSVVDTLKALEYGYSGYSIKDDRLEGAYILASELTGLSIDTLSSYVNNTQKEKDDKDPVEPEEDMDR